MPKPTYEELELRVLEVETARRERENALRELDDRVKKLNCLYGLSRLEDKPGETLDELLQETAYLIPSSWQYPDIACARVSVGNKHFTSGEFEETPWVQSGDIKVYEDVVGKVEVYYREERPPLDEGPFSKEERLLLDVVAERLGRIIERRQAEEALDHEFAIDEALSELYKPLISSLATMEEISVKIRDQALQLTGSAHGYVSTIDRVTGDNVCHTFTEMIEGQCNVESGKRKNTFPIGEDGRYKGLWGYSLNTREPFFTNTPSTHPSFVGVPGGHIPLERFLSIPVMLGDELVGQIALANKGEGYTSRDLEAVSRLAEYYALAIRRMWDRAALQESEERFRYTFEQAAMGISHVAPDGRFLRVNRRFCDIVGYTREEILTRTFQDITHPDDLEANLAYTGRMLNGEIETFAMEKRYFRKDGSIVWVYLTVSLMWDEAGKPLHFITAAEDVSRRKQVEDELKNAHDVLECRVKERTSELEAANRQLNREIKEREEAQEEQEKLAGQLREAQKAEAVGTLAGGIAHDFNNILGVIIGYTQLAKDVLAPDDQAVSMLDSILNAGDRAKDLIQQILAFSWDSSQDRKPMQIPPVIKEVVNLLNATIPKNIVIHRDIDPGCGTILGNAGQIHQVLMNLCTNAYHAMREYGGTLTVALKPVDIPAGSNKTGDMELPPGAYVRLEVSDTGHGMSQNVMERIFDPYFSTKKKGEGTGLGLAVVQGIVKSHNGIIRVSSTPGKGATFSICLPRLDVESGVSQSALTVPLPRGDEHILFVDDEEHLVNIWTRVLEKLGYDVTATTSSVEALELFRANPGGFDLVITDMNMPHLTGSQLTKDLIEIRPDIPVILCTGYSEMMGKGEAKNIGFREYVMKPVLREDFTRTIRKVLDE